MALQYKIQLSEISYGSPPSPLLLYTLLSLQLGFTGPAGLTTNWVSPLAQAAWSIGTTGAARLKSRVLNIPLDSDIQSMYASLPVISGTSLFATAIYDEASRKGLVLGFLDHGLFKTGIQYGVEHITAVAGVNGKLLTRDVAPHGMVPNLGVASAVPTLAIGG